MGMGMGTRRVRFGEFVDYIQKNYRMNLNSIDYELLTKIADDHSANEIMQAITYCKKKGQDSLVYLQKALVGKYYQENNSNSIPGWMNENIEKQPLDDSDIEYFQDFYQRYCGDEEILKEKIQEMTIENSKIKEEKKSK